jgi:hypothetical protein
MNESKFTARSAGEEKKSTFWGHKENAYRASSSQELEVEM